VNDRGAERFFFIHVMKTGGGTFVQHIRANFDRSEVYPFAELDPEDELPRFNIPYLTALAPERLAKIRLFMGHFPFVAVQLLGMEVQTITILRDPVERTISYLKHCQRYHDQHRALSLEEIYADPLYYPMLIRDHQAKLFSMTPDDQPDSYHDVIDVDDRRLEIAKSNLEQVDVLGLQERFEDFLAEIAHRFGWRFPQVSNRHVGGESDVSSAFRRRIAEDNAADLEFYEHARRLWERRRVPALS
jgi:hypothetical protein